MKAAYLSKVTRVLSVIALIMLFNNCGQGFKALQMKDSSSLSLSPTPRPNSPTPIPSATSTPRPSATPMPTATSTPRPSATPTATPTPTPRPSSTPTPTPTVAPTPAPTSTPRPSTPTPTPPTGALPAFPGAEGFGTTTRGGRGGKVLVVTNLNGSGPGSFREAMLTTGPRIIIFQVSGVINLGGSIHLLESHSNVTILGQSSPGGITLVGGAITNYQTNLHDVIIRFLTIRAQTGDTIAFNPIYNLVIDHVDTSGGADETFDIDASHDFTVQWSTIANSVRPPNSQNYGALIAYRPTTNITFHHNLHAHHGGRCGAQFHWNGSSPIPGGSKIDLRNNVFYNCGFQQIYRADQSPAEGTNWNLMGNYAKAGPNTPSGSMIFGLGGTVYMNDNLYPGQSIMSIYTNPTYLSAPHPFPGVTTTSALQAYEDVLDFVGSWPRDPMNIRTVNEVRNGTGTLGKIDDPLKTSTGPAALTDTDKDGIPDSWESSHGLNFNDPLDSARLHLSGYAHVEVYLNEVAQEKIGD